MSKTAEERAREYAYRGIPEEYKETVKPIADTIIDNYIKGYEQAEKDTIDYACYELEFRLPECLNYNGIQVERAEFIKDFRKAMEEE